MQKDLFGLTEPKDNILTGKRVGSKRNAFPIKTKKIEWTKTTGRVPYKYIAHRKFIKTPKCRQCGRPLTWGDQTYDFDHKDNNPANISQKKLSFSLQGVTRKSYHHY